MITLNTTPAAYFAPEWPLLNRPMTNVTAGSAIPHRPQDHLTDPGNYAEALAFHDSFDQDENLAEWAAIWIGTIFTIACMLGLLGLLIAARLKR